MKHVFHGAFAPYIYGLIEKKRSLGYDYYESERILRTFDEFCREQFPCETNLTASSIWVVRIQKKSDASDTAVSLTSMSDVFRSGSSCILPASCAFYSTATAM